MKAQDKNGLNPKAFNVPKGWSVKKIAEIGKVFSGGTPDTTKPEFWNGNINWCTPTDITALKGNKFIGHTEVKITAEGLKSSSASLLPKGSVIVCTRASIGKAAIALEEISTNQGFKNIIPNVSSDADFIYYSILNSEKKLIRLGNGSTFLEIPKSDFENIQFLFPPLTERNKIASILSKWDKAIELTEKLIVVKERQKTGLLQKLFSSKNKKSNFKLGNECEIITKGTTPTTNGFPFQSSGINFIKIESLEEDGTILPNKVAYISEEAHASLKRSQLKENDILISIAGALGRVTLIKKSILPANTNQALGIIRLNKKGNLDFTFVYYFLQSPIIKKRIKEINVQAAQANLSLADLNSFTIPRLPIPVQQKTSSFLFAADRELQLLKAKLCTLRKEKNGLMHELLTGRKRVRI